MRRHVLLAILSTLVLFTTPLLAAPTIPGFVEDTVATGLSYPTGIAFLPDGRFLAIEQGGGLYLVEIGSAPSFVTTIPVAPFPCNDFETGLLGIAVDPDFSSNGYLYLYRTNDHGSPCGYPPDGWTNEVIRVTMDATDAIDLDSLVIILPGIRCNTGYHNGGGLRIGPDNKLYVSVGDMGVGDFTDQGPGSSQKIDAQDLNALEGKLLRLNIPDGSIPQDNPYAGQAGRRGEIWASGFRGDAIMGGTIAGCAFGSLSGHYFFGDVERQTISMVQANAAHDGVVGSAATFATDAGGPVDVVFGPDGALYYTATYWGEIRRIAGPLGEGSQPISAKKILLRSLPKKVLQILSQDDAIIICGIDPTVTGATLEVRGSGFENTYTLPASGWSPIVKSGNLKGYNYKDPNLINGPIHVAQIKDGKIKILGKGPGLGHLLGEIPPIDVDVHLSVGSKEYCMGEFEGEPTFTPFKRYRITDVPAPPFCK